MKDIGMSGQTASISPHRRCPTDLFTVGGKKGGWTRWPAPLWVFIIDKQQLACCLQDMRSQSLFI